MREHGAESDPAAAEPLSAPRHAPAPAGRAERVLELQRSHGNRAVTRVLARRTSKQIFEDSVAAKDWSGAATELGGFDKAQIGAALGFLTPDQLRYLDDAASRQGASTTSRSRSGIAKALGDQGVTKA